MIMGEGWSYHSVDVVEVEEARGGDYNAKAGFQEDSGMVWSDQSGDVLRKVLRSQNLSLFHEEICFSTKVYA